jgi:hypothetical protein
MPGGRHDVSGGLTLGKAGAGAVLEGETPPVPIKTVSRERAREQRLEMLSVCNRCHVPRVGYRALADADAIKREADLLVGRGARIVHDLQEEGLLGPVAQAGPAHATAGEAPVPGASLTFQDPSDVGRLFFDLSKLAHAITFKSAYHQSPDFTHWVGMVRMKSDLEALDAAARRLRAAAGPRAGAR